MVDIQKINYKIIIKLHTGSHYYGTGLNVYTRVLNVSIVSGTGYKLMMKSKLFSLMFKTHSNTALPTCIILFLTAHN